MAEGTALASAPGDVHRFPCPACGAAFRFDPAAGRLVCDHCGTAREMDQDCGPWAKPAIRERDFEAALRDLGAMADIEETRVLRCGACGAEVEVDEEVHGTACPFCASAVVADTGTHRHIKPAAIAPFAMDEATARAAMKAWLGRLWFAPTGLARYARSGRAMAGIYTPYWTFDARTETRYTGQRGTVHHRARTVMRNGKPQRVTETRVHWRNVRGRVARAFDDVLVVASRALPARFTDALAPWDLSHLVPYAPEYVAGLRAEGYTVDLDAGFAAARGIMDATIARDVRFDIGGDRQRITGLETDVADVRFKHVLLPIWVAAYRYRGASYRIVINGQTGRVHGERPWSIWKVALAVVAGLLAAAAIGYGIAVIEGIA